MTTTGYPDPAMRLLITVAALLAVMMATIDSTIAIIALPRIQSSLAASQEQIAWVLTSYLVSAAIMTPLSGWLANRFGRARVMAASVFFFTLSSIGCGLSANLETLVAMRFIQGASGASLVPLSQVLLMDINPPEKQGPAIAWFGVGTLFGPMIGPTLGAWLAENISWRTIFLINAPIGVLAFLGLLFYARSDTARERQPFDLTGFCFVSVTLTAFQLMLDRGQLLDWFASTEVCIEACVAGLFAYWSVVHMLTTDHPFIKPRIFLNGSYVIGALLSVLVGVLLNGVIPIMVNMMQNLLGYPTMTAGLLQLPRAIGNIIVVFVVGRLVARFDARHLIFAGMIMLVLSLWMLTGLSLETQKESFILITFLQGCGSGFIFLPLTIAVFVALPAELRNEGSALYALIRNVAGAAGISLIQSMTIRDTARAQSRLVEHVRPDNPIADLRLPGFDWTDPHAIAGMVAQVSRQAAMVAYVDSFLVILVLAIVLAPLCLLLRVPRNAAPPPKGAVAHAE